MGRGRPQDRLIAATLAAVIAVALVATACDSGGSDEPAKDASTTLVADAHASKAQLAAAASTIDARLAKAGYPAAETKVEHGKVAVTNPRAIDPGLLSALVRKGELGFRLVENQMPAAKCGDAEWIDATKSNGCYQLGPSLLPASALRSAHASTQDPDGWGVDVTFRGDDFMRLVATPNVGRQIAIVVDGTMVSAPVVNPGITGHVARISGNFSEGAARGLAAILNEGKVLPVGFTVVASND